MKNLIQHRFACEQAMFNYIHGHTKESLLKSELKQIEKRESVNNKNEDKELWFKFGSDDCLATTIDELIGDLNGNVNKSFRQDQILSILGVNSELEVYFS